MTDMDYFEKDLHDTVVSGNIESLHKYFKCGLNVDYVFRYLEDDRKIGKTLVSVAACEKQLDIVKELIKKKCNTNLIYVVDVDPSGLIVKEYAKHDGLKLTAMYTCIVRGETEMVKVLVEGGFDVNMYDDRGCSALWHAVDLNNYAMAKVMVRSQSCHVNMLDRMKLSPLHVAAIHGNFKMVSLLVGAGAEVDAIQIRGSTPLILAARAQAYNVTRLLLLNGADPNHLGHNGHTPLSTAVQACSDRQIPDMLINAGAYIDIGLVRKCREEAPPLLKLHPEILEVLTDLASTPRPLKVLCGLGVRKYLLQSASRQHLVYKVQTLPVPTIVREFILLSHI